MPFIEASNIHDSNDSECEFVYRRVELNFNTEVKDDTTDDEEEYMIMNEHGYPVKMTRRKVLH